MVTTKTAFIPQGKLIQIMADTEVIESHQLDTDEKATVIINIEKVSQEKKETTT